MLFRSVCELVCVGSCLTSPSLPPPHLPLILNLSDTSFSLPLMIGECFLCSGELNSTTVPQTSFMHVTVPCQIFCKSFNRQFSSSSIEWTVSDTSLDAIRSNVQLFSPLQVCGCLGWQPKSGAPEIFEAPPWLCVHAFLSLFFRSMSVLHQCTLTCSIVHTVAASGECECLVCLFACARPMRKLFVR